MNEIQAKIDALVAESQALGAQVDAIREQRRRINAEVAQLTGTLKLQAALHASPEIRHAIAPGATVDVSATDVLQAMLGPKTQQ
jgi:prefoldin subunit 5